MLRGQYTTQEMQEYLEKVSTAPKRLPKSANDVAKFAVNAVKNILQKLETAGSGGSDVVINRPAEVEYTLQAQKTIDGKTPPAGES